jgi:protein required for attachment to host cells
MLLPPTRTKSDSRRSRAPSQVGQGITFMKRSRFSRTPSEEERFLHTLAKHVDAQVKAGHVKSIVIVAPPRALGMLRPAYSHDLRKALHAEIDKDLVAMPLHEIEKHL